MRRRTVLNLRLLAAASAFAAVACTSGPPPPDEGPYQTTIERVRADNQAFFKSKDSPVAPESRASFKGLAYFPIDSSYRVPARLEVNTVDRATVLELPQSHTTEKRKVRRIGVLHFALPAAGSTDLTLTAFVEVDAPDMNRLFVPFTDGTSGKDTYGGGRYLELTRTPTGLYDLDFNRAYHPYCLFNPGYECPVPPRENRLMVAVRAGEKLPQ